MFESFLKLGIEHILDLNGLDHLLYILALSIIFAVNDWKRLIILVTAFTIGHSISLALSALQIISINPDIIETIIPLTILLTALSNLFFTTSKKNITAFYYAITLGFGLIHGLGFSNYFKTILGQESSIVLPLFSFNFGVEIAQLTIVFITIGIVYFLNVILKVQRNWIVYSVSILIILISLRMIFEGLSF